MNLISTMKRTRSFRIIIIEREYFLYLLLPHSMNPFRSVAKLKMICFN